MKKILSLVWVCLGITLGLSGQGNAIEKLRQHIVDYVLNEEPEKQQVSNFSATINDDGSWPDIDYANKTKGEWKTYSHLLRTLDMAIAYNAPGNPLYRNPQLLASTRKALDYWITNDFQNPNWWYPDIGVPKILGPIILLMEKELSQVEMEAGLKILERSKIGRTGQNKVWLSGNVIYYNVLTGNEEMIGEAARSIQEEVRITEEEGIQPDFSFHQHGHQQQFGNYGLSFANDIMKWAIILNGTSYEFKKEKIEILRNYLLNGMRWIVWNGHFDISACGRQIFPDAQLTKARALGNIYRNMPRADQEYTAKYKDAMNSYRGNIHFWHSDMSVQRRANYYASVKMSSKRVSGSETINSENIQGYHLGDGALFVYRTAEEYTNIFPFWDWKKIPGTTCFQDKAPLPWLTSKSRFINSNFVGGVSDGENGLAAMCYARDSLDAFKAYMFFDDIILCLGAGINTPCAMPVATSVNQCFLKGMVWVNSENNVQTLSKGAHQMNKVQWVWHDSIGYFFPEKTSVNIENMEKSGTWHRVMEPMPDQTIKADIFNAWIDHGVGPRNAGYVYGIVPGVTMETMDKMSQRIRIISNTTSLQAATCEEKGLTEIVFYKEGSCKVSDVFTVTTDTPCMVMLSGKNGYRRIGIADPTHLVKKVKLSIPGQYNSNSVLTTYDKSTHDTCFDIMLPTGPDAGKTLFFDIRKL